MDSVQDWLALLAAFVAGMLVAWLAAAWRRSRLAERLAAAEATAAAERERRAELERQLAERQGDAAELSRRLAVAEDRFARTEALLEEEKGFLERTRRELENSFRALAAEALQGNREQFLTLAEQKLSVTRTQAAAELDERRKAIENLLQPLREALGELAAKAADMERARVDAYSRMDQQVRMLAQATATLEEKTTSLAGALRGSPQMRGRWGEIALRNVAELAGMSEHCDFEEQTGTGDGGRPDMTVRLPGGRLIAVDAKAPVAAFLEASDAPTEEARRDALRRHARELRAHVRELARRRYAETLAAGVDLVVLFLPGDSFLAAAFAEDPNLQIDALRERVLIATPSTLVALLRTVAFSWQQSVLAESAEEIARTARSLYDRAAKFQEDLGAIGKGLHKAIEAYNRAVGSYTSRLLPLRHRLDSLKVAEQARRREPEELAPVDVAPRELDS